MEGIVFSLCGVPKMLVRFPVFVFPGQRNCISLLVRSFVFLRCWWPEDYQLELFLSNAHRKVNLAPFQVPSSWSCKREDILDVFKSRFRCDTYLGWLSYFFFLFFCLWSEDCPLSFFIQQKSIYPGHPFKSPPGFLEEQHFKM